MQEGCKCWQPSNTQYVGFGKQKRSNYQSFATCCKEARPPALQESLGYVRRRVARVECEKRTGIGFRVFPACGPSTGTARQVMWNCVYLKCGSTLGQGAMPTITWDTSRRRRKASNTATTAGMPYRAHLC